MKILVDGLPRTIGGIGSLILNIADYSFSLPNNENVEFEFIVAGYSGYSSTLEKNGYKYYVAPSIQNLREYILFLKRLFAENQFDYLWFNNTSKVNIWLPLCAKDKGVKVITHPHGVDIEEKGMKRFFFKLLNIINSNKMFSLVDIPLACSEDAADEYYKGASKLRKQTTIIHNGISTSRFTFSEKAREQIRKELGVQADDYLLGAVGRLTRVKNYPFLIEMLTLLDDHYKLIVLGDGEGREELEALIDEKSVRDRCWLLGMKSNPQDYMSAMDFFLLPSLNEGMPYSVIEAQSEGLPCVVSDTLSDELKITNLVLYKSITDPQKWADALRNTAVCKCRSDYSELVKKSGYSIEKTYEEFVSLLKRN